MVYTLPGVPAWNSAATPISFLLAAFLMGIPLAALLAGAGGRTCALLVGAAALAALLVTLTQVTALQAGEPAAAASGFLLAEAPKFQARVALLAVAALAGLAFGLRSARSAEPAPGKAASVDVFLLLFCLLAASETLGRELFFSAIVRL